MGGVHGAGGVHKAGDEQGWCVWGIIGAWRHGKKVDALVVSRGLAVRVGTIIAELLQS